MQRANSLEKTLMLGKIEGRRKRGQQGMRWLDGIIDSTDMNLSKFWEIVKGGEAWCTAVHGVSKSWTQFSDWTTRTILTDACMALLRSRHILPNLHCGVAGYFPSWTSRSIISASTVTPFLACWFRGLRNPKWPGGQVAVTSSSTESLFFSQSNHSSLWNKYLGTSLVV